MYQLKEKEMIFVLTGPYGAGRKTLAHMVSSTFGMKEVISYTTRPRRPIEVDGQDYYFISEEEFRQAEEKGEFIESVEIDGYHYGIKNKDVERLIKSKGCVCVVLNRYGADILKQLYGDKVVRLFIYVDRKTAEERQRKLGLSEEVIEKHLKHYDEEMAYRGECEHVFENYDLAHTGFAITNTIESYLDTNYIVAD